MVLHSECLRGICRTCGKTNSIVEGRHPIQKEKFNRQLFRAFGITVNDEDTGIYPPYICKLCEVKVMQWWKKFSGKNNKSAQCNIDVAVFKSSECDRCRGKSPSVQSLLVDHEAAAQRSRLLTWFGNDFLQIMKAGSDGCVAVYLSVFSDFSWKLKIAGVVVEDTSCIPLQLPEMLRKDDCERLCSAISSGVICEGNSDFQELVQSKTGADGQVPMYITPQDSLVEGTIRHLRCRLLLTGPSFTRCDVCRIHRSDLSAMLHRVKAKEGVIITASSKIPNCSMSVLQLQQKADKLQAERRALRRSNTALQAKISTLLEKESVSLELKQESTIKEAMMGFDEEMMATFPIDSPSRLMWEQQKESALKGKQMRWHPAVIRLCIALQSKSAAAYNLFRESGFIRLPHQSTLHPYSHFADSTLGFSSAMLERIVADHNLESCPEEERHVSLLFDEMKVKSGLVYSVRTDKIVGFTEITEVVDEMSCFEQRCRGEGNSNEASHVLALMVRGLFSSLHVPVGYYATRGVTSYQLYPCISQAIIYLEFAGFKVWAMVCDGASSNHKFYRLQGTATSTSPAYYTDNPIDASRRIYFICDVPHLIKTTRNNFENSGYHNKTRKLCYDNKSISWTQILQLYEWDVGLTRSSPGLRRLHKISYEHLHLTPSLRMRVYMAAQVLSSTVANALESVGHPATSSTIKFLRYMDQFFDCLNVSNPLQGMRSRKPALEPYTSPDDWRFKWLISDFLGFFDDWEKQVQAIPDLDSKTRQSMCLSKETVEGIRITVHSFVDLGKLLLSFPGVKYLLSEKLNQDPLEEYFSKQRGAGGSWDNPTVEQFGHNMLALYVASSSAKASRKGNVRKRSNQDNAAVIDSTPLPKRKKKSLE